MYKNSLTRQINEVESLQAMFCGPNELTLWNENEFASLKLVLQGKQRAQDTLPQIAFQLQLPLDHPFTQDLILCVNMPAFYPSEVVDVRVSLDTLTPQEEKDLRAATTTFVESKQGQECVLDVVQYAKDWVYDHVAPVAKQISNLSKLSISNTPAVVSNSTVSVASSAPVTTTTTSSVSVSITKVMPQQPITIVNAKPAASSLAPVPASSKSVPAKPSAQANKAKPKGKASAASQAQKEQEFRRILIWFSTIAPDRAKTIAEWAKQLGLSGISRLGSPAMIVVEGQREDVDEYVSSLRSYRWKKMEIVWEDKMKSTNVNACRKFPNFQECMMSLPDLQQVFKKAGLEDMYKEGLKIRG